ncbi:MAG TPA: DUF1501 domain-containing protein [Humisphaera sp.]
MTPVSPLTRRQMLQRATLGFGSLAMLDLLSGKSLAAQAEQAARATAAALRVPGASPLAAKVPHFPARAKRVIYLFLDGGLSQVDSYDYKPLLQRDDGKPLPASIAKPKFTFAPTGALLRSPFEWKQHGQSGAWASNLFPEVNKQIDSLCFIKSLHHDNEDHVTAKNMIFTGSGREPRPNAGSWAAYGLGTENANLPAFIEIMPGAPKSWPSAFLPATYGSTAIGRPDEKLRDRSWDNLGGDPHTAVAGPKRKPAAQLRQLELIRAMNRDHADRTGLDRAIEGEIQNMELAFRMQTEAPDLLSLAGESPETRRMYGVGEPVTDDFGRACLLARRFAERGVRWITVMHSTRAFGNLWDQHKDLYDGHRKNAEAVDLPIAGLLTDLRRRGMLEDTLVICGSEFGRTPVFEFQDGGDGRLRNGRDHNPHGFTMWFAGAGTKPGFSYGETDDYGYYAVKDKVHVHDLHATVLAAMGIDHERLTYRHAGRDFRLTDVSGSVVEDIFG